jgi:hydroxymethylbilane synthase
MTLRIGTRRSRLALAQAEEVAYHLALLGIQSELVPMTTSGDHGALVPGAAGVKGLFVAEIVRALQVGDVDLAVHSAKDLPAHDPDGIVTGAVPEREDPLDVLVTRDDVLDAGSSVGTSSLRRTAQLRRLRPDVLIVEIRGNVDSRLVKLERGEVDGLVLAAAGLARLGIAPKNAVPFPIAEMVPAPGQGALAVQVRADDAETLEVAGRLDHAGSRAAFEAERELVRLLGGDCSLPVGAYAEERDGLVRLLGIVIRPDGSDLIRAEAEAPTPVDSARLVAEALLAEGAGVILADVQAGG